MLPNTIREGTEKSEFSTPDPKEKIAKYLNVSRSLVCKIVKKMQEE